jgi:hypothetical protein
VAVGGACSDDADKRLYETCFEAEADRATPVRKGDPGYGRHLDLDGDGVACD